MDLLPILTTLRRHRTAAGLIVLEIALTSAIVCNALHLISTRLAVLNQDSGLPESELVVLGLRSTAIPGNADGVTAMDLQGLRALPGVKSATIVNQVVYGNNSNNSGVSIDPAQRTDRIVAADYAAGEDALATMGLKLVEGRDFKREEFLAGSVVNQQAKPSVSQVIVNRELAAKLYPGKSALGEVIYVFGDAPSTIVGVVQRLTHPYPGKQVDRLGYSHAGYAMLFPIRPSYRGGKYLIRVQLAQREAVLKAAAAVIERNDSSRIVFESKRLSDMRADYYAQDRAMVWLMGGVIVALLVVTAFGIVGLASFWVQQRTRMIGTRRALGATRGQILRYFQLENFMLSSAGIVLGMVGAFGLSLLLMANYELPRLPFVFLPAGAVALWALGQLAVLAPARRAAALPPVAALRG